TLGSMSAYMVDDTHPSPDVEMTDLLRQMRARVDAAARDIESLTEEVTSRNRTIDQLESLVDALLDIAEIAVVVIGHDRRAKALSRVAARDLNGFDPVGKPASSVLPEDVIERVSACLDDGPGVDPGEREGVRVQRLPGGDALVVLSA